MLLNNAVSYNVYRAYLDKNKPQLDKYVTAILEGLYDEAVPRTHIDSLCSAIDAWTVWRAEEHARTNRNR